MRRRRRRTVRDGLLAADVDVTKPGAGWRRRHKALAGGAAVVLLAVAVWGIKVVHLRRDVDRYRRYWSQPQGEPEGLLYVALGDSTAQGIGASSPERGYVGLIADRLREGRNGSVRVVNLSRSGARVRDVVAEQLPRLAELKPDLVTVAVGANDMGRLDPVRFRADVDALIAGLPAGTVVGDVPWFMHGGTGRASDQAARDVAQAARARGLGVAELHGAMERRGWWSMATDFAPDLFHPNDRGYRIWAEAFWKALPDSAAGHLERAGVKA